MSPPRDGEDPPDDGPADDPSNDATDDGPPRADDASGPDDASAGDPLAPDRSTGSGGDDGLPGESDGESDVAPNGAGGTVDAPPARRADPEPERQSGGALRTFVVDVLSSAIAVLLVGVLLFAVSGVWPPMVAVESRA
ncbi:hypothetical protein ACFQL4_24015 [Halosimplex aquaticum]